MPVGSILFMCPCLTGRGTSLLWAWCSNRRGPFGLPSSRLTETGLCGGRGGPFCSSTPSHSHPFDVVRGQVSVCLLRGPATPPSPPAVRHHATFPAKKRGKEASSFFLTRSRNRELPGGARVGGWKQTYRETYRVVTLKSGCVVDSSPF